MSLVARRHDINANLLFTWRRQMRTPTSAASPLELVPVEVISSAWAASPTAAAGVEELGMIEIVLVGGVRVRVAEHYDTSILPTRSRKPRDKAIVS